MTNAFRTIAHARPLAVLATLLLCAALTACGGDSDNNPPANGGGGAGTPDQPAAKPTMKCAP